MNTFRQTIYCERICTSFIENISLRNTFHSLTQKKIMNMYKKNRYPPLVNNPIIHYSTLQTSKGGCSFFEKNYSYLNTFIWWQLHVHSCIIFPFEDIFLITQTFRVRQTQCLQNVLLSNQSLSTTELFFVIDNDIISLVQ